MAEMGNQPKGSASWVAEQGGEEATTTAPAESKATPQTDTAQEADRQVGVSAQNNAEANEATAAEAVMGYDQQIAALQAAANRYKPETEEERKKRERRERSKKVMAAVGDGLMALGNLYFTSRGAPNMYDHKTMSQQTQLQTQLDKLKAEREANADKYLQYSLKMGDMRNGRAKTLREMEAEQEKRRLAREKAEREVEAQGWERALQPGKLKEQNEKANKAASEAVTAGEEAKNAPAMQAAKLVAEQNRGKAAAAQTAASYAAARASDRSNVNEFSAWDESGREHRFRTKEAAEAYARQHGTTGSEEVTSTSSTDSEVTNKSGKIVREVVGRTRDGKPRYGAPVRRNSTTTTSKTVSYPKRVAPPAPKPAPAAKQQPQQQAQKPAAQPQQAKPQYKNTKALGL